jgi:hypothetical protein
MFRIGLATSAAIAIVLPFCVMAPGANAKDPPATLSGGLALVPGAKVVLAYERPGVIWSKYKSIQLTALDVPTMVRDTAPKGERPGFGESYVLRDKDVADLQADYAKVTRDVLGKAGFTFVDAPQADTLVVAVRVINITLNAPIESTRASNIGRGGTATRGAGAMSIAAVLADGQSGQVIAEAADRKFSTDLWRINDRVSNMADARKAFGEWARLLRDHLISAR